MKNFTTKELEMKMTINELGSEVTLKDVMKHHSRETVIKYDAKGNMVGNRTTELECLDTRDKNGYLYFTILQQQNVLGPILKVETTFKVIKYDFRAQVKIVSEKKYITTIPWNDKEDIRNMVILPYGWIEDVIKEANECVKKKYIEFIKNK